MNSITLAFIGDAVYELYVRERVAERMDLSAAKLHREAVKYVRAESQAVVLKKMMKSGFFTEEETALIKKARNHKTPNRSRSANPVEYKLATAFEALLGSLYTENNRQRLAEIMEKAALLVESEEETK